MMKTESTPTAERQLEIHEKWKRKEEQGRELSFK